MKVRNLSKMPQRKVTIDDVLYRADIDGVLADINKDKEELSEILVIASNSDNEILWRYSGIPLSWLIYLMEVVKNALLNDEVK